ncbi:MAG: hypothetical protein HRT69_16075 [Flavobacteriaceae bacterium]|nr:hypothetical protein [Flavobacteriaceae bacterium]
MKVKILLMLLAVFSININAQISNTDLVSQYNFVGGSLSDASMQNDLIQQSTNLLTDTDRALYVNNAINLNGDYLVASNNTPSQDLGISFWIKTTTNDSNKRIILNLSDHTANILDNSNINKKGWYVSLENGQLTFAGNFYSQIINTQTGALVSNSYTGYQYITPPNIVSDGNWHHIVFNAEKTLNINRYNYKAYIDNVQVGFSSFDGEQLSGQSQSASTSFMPNKPLSVANFSDTFVGINNRYGDLIDDIKFYSKAISTTLVTDLYNDDIVCTPTNVEISNIGASSTDVSWYATPNQTSWEVGYVLENMPVSGATIISGINTTNTTITGLQNNTSYDVYVRANCNGSLSGWSIAQSFSIEGRVYVNVNATGSNDGTSWTNAYTSLQDGITSAGSLGFPIWVAQGTYKPHASNRFTPFQLSSNMQVFGGFNGTEANFSDRNPSINETILSGDLNGDDAGAISFINTTRDDNSFRIVYIQANNTLLDGFTISDGHANSTNALYTSGAAIYKNPSVQNFSIANCIIENNVATNGGGGIFLKFSTINSLSVSVESCVFKNNLSTIGAGYYSTTFNTNGYTSALTARFSNSLFLNNKVLDNGSDLGYAGSALYQRVLSTDSSVELTLNNNTFVNNQDQGTNSNLVSGNRSVVGASKNQAGIINVNAYNNIFWSNTEIGGVTSKSIANPTEDAPTSLAVYNSIGEDNFTNATSTTSILNQDPSFTDSVNEDYTLLSGSVAIDSGDNSIVQSSTDINGNFRIYNAVVDMGAYESTFGPNNKSLTLNIIGSGVTDINSGVHADGTVLSITAASASGQIFYGWTGDITSTDNPLTVTMDSNKVINATFSKIILVDHTATGNNDGTTWVNAYNDLKDAIAIANSGDSIWIADGIYTPSTSARNTYYTINKEGLKLYGGFEGTETSLDQRIIGANETILSGDIQGNDANVVDYISNYSNTSRQDNSYRIINITATGNNLLLDGLTIGDAHNNASTTSKGAAIYKEKTVSNLTLKNCIIRDNVARNDNSGLLAEFQLNNTATNRGALIIENCQFINNMSRWATSIYSIIRSNTYVDITISNSLFDKNISANLNTTNAQGISGSAGWFRMLGNSSDVNFNFVNNTLINNIDKGTNSVSANTHAVLAISKSSGFNGVFNTTVANNIFWNNKTIGNAITRSITDLYKLPVTSVNVYNSIDESNFNDSSITSITNTSNLDPLFTDVGNGDYTLQSGSPAIDSGDNSYATATLDLVANTRIQGGTVDMGCYESVSLAITIDIDVFLQGPSLSPSTAGLMNDDLRIGGYIPTTSPYSDNLTCNASVFIPTGNDAIVDWVFIELRDANTNTSVLHSQSALLQRDGDVVGVDGTSIVSFAVALGNYYVAVKHRNHLGVMTSTAIALTSSAAIVNFTGSSNPITYGTNAQSSFGMQSGKLGMWAGNIGADTSVRYQGSGNDTNSLKDAVLADSGNTTTSNLHSFTGYSIADINLDGSVRYQGSGNDANTVKDIMLAHPDNQSAPSNLFVILEQLPEN